MHTLPDVIPSFNSKKESKGGDQDLLVNAQFLCTSEEPICYNIVHRDQFEKTKKK